jgi:CheY-like chemotaxis protein
VVDLVAVEVNRKGLELICDLDPTVPTCVDTDEARLRQILVNLVGNAVKFTKVGEIYLHLRAEPLDEDALTLTFTVRDTGIGIPTDKQQAIFEQFVQADTSHTRRFGGAGLGLAISQRLAAVMGGEITVESEPDAGAVFVCRIKVGKRADAPQAQRLARRAGQRTLIIHPNATMRRMLTGLLAQWGQRVQAVAQMNEARQTLAGAPPVALIVLDHSAASPSVLDALCEWAPDAEVCILAPPQAHTLREQAAHPRVFFVTKPLTPFALWNILAAETTPAPVQPPPAPGTARQLHTKVLVAEDNLVNQKVIVHILERGGYRVDVVGNGSEAVEAIRRTPYLVVFMDIQMPNMDGLEATRVIRQLAEIAAQPQIIALTAAVTEIDRENCLAAGMNDFVAKPARSEDVLAALQRALAAAAQPVAPSPTR